MSSENISLSSDSIALEQPQVVSSPNVESGNSFTSYLILIIVVVLLGAVLYYYFTSSKKKSKEQREHDYEKRVQMAMESSMKNYSTTTPSNIVKVVASSSNAITV